MFERVLLANEFFGKSCPATLALKFFGVFAVFILESSVFQFVAAARGAVNELVCQNSLSFHAVARRWP